MMRCAELTQETEAMWKLLAKQALESGELRVAERSYAAIGDASRARYLADTIAIADNAQKKFVRSICLVS